MALVATSPDTLEELAWWGLSARASTMSEGVGRAPPPAQRTLTVVETSLTDTG